MKKFSLFILTLLTAVGAWAASSEVKSPNGKISVSTDGSHLQVNYQNKKVVDINIGMEKAMLGSEFVFSQKIKADYTMLEGKKSHCTNEANEYQLGALRLRLYNDGIAFRYELKNLQGENLPKEQTGYLLPEGSKRWMMQWLDSYENFFPLTTSYKQKPDHQGWNIEKSPEGYNTKWCYPFLIEPEKDVFALISEANIERNQSASFLRNQGECFQVIPDENNAKISGDWHSPWRVAIIGGLKDIVESTLITDLADPCKLKDTKWIQPGTVAWVYWAYNHGSNDYIIIKKYTDMAVKMKLPYVLIDAEWDQMKDGKTIEDAVKYAVDKGIKPIIWYNSSIGWIDGAPTPKFKLNTPEDREKEFEWCEKIGVAGIKIDFFSGDNLKNMDLCLDLLEAAAKHHLLVNFHGATVPRGWQRTYPNLMSTEGVYGAEWYNNVPTFTDRAASHNTTLPFTRNVIGPMDYTPCTFSDSQHPHITSNAHELALTVLFESGLQHLADKPESYYAQPKEVQNFLSELPTTWDETRYISGYPGENVVLARRKGNKWYVAGINGSNDKLTINLDLSPLKKSSKSITTFMDKATKTNPWDIKTLKKLPKTIELQPRGGFVMVL